MLVVYWIFVSVYFLLNTIVIHGLFEGHGGREKWFPLLRDSVWIVFVGRLMYKNPTKISLYRQKTSSLWGVLGLFLIIGLIVSFFSQTSAWQIILGIKYIYLVFFRFLTAFFVGMCVRDHTPFFKKLLARIVFTGLVFTGMKIVFAPQFQMIGRGPVGDFVAGKSPPVYYRTGSGGVPRLDGIMQGPNNYSYFLVAFLPLFFLFYREWSHRSLYIVSLLLTLSRGGILGALATQYPKLGYIKQNRKKLWPWFVGAILIVLALSFSKMSSTIEHIEVTTHSIQVALEKPFGHGLGSSGPSAIRGGQFLPENMYLQVMVDTGILGFVCYIVLWGMVLSLLRGNAILWALRAGLIGLLVEGMFLHSLEDSIVNILFFTYAGIVVGQHFYATLLQKN